ncbi:hypothetical protein BH09VER1_BH09VER1_36310 [soil metagenome]
MPRLFSYFFLFLFLAQVCESAPPKKQAITPLFQFDASQFPLGKVNSETLEEMSPSGNAQIPVIFHLRDKDPNASAEIVELEGKIKALRIAAPPLPKGTEPPYPIAMYFDDANLSSQIDSTKPFFLEIRFERKGAPIHFSVTAYLRAVDSPNLPFTHAGLGVIAPKGNYQAIKTPIQPNPEREDGPDVPSDEILTLRYEIAPNSNGLIVKTKLLSGSDLLFETQDPAVIKDKSLNELCGLWMMAMHYADGEDTGGDSIDLLSINGWQ